MTLEKQVTSLELSKKLKELIESPISHFGWYRSKTTGDYFVEQISPIYKGQPREFIAYAFTVAELGEKLNDAVKKIGRTMIIDPRGRFDRMTDKIAAFEDEADNRAKMLIYLIENDLIVVKKD